MCSTYSNEATRTDCEMCEFIQHLSAYKLLFNLVDKNFQTEWVTNRVTENYVLHNMVGPYEKLANSTLGWWSTKSMSADHEDSQTTNLKN